MASRAQRVAHDKGRRRALGDAWVVRFGLIAPVVAQFAEGVSAICRAAGGRAGSVRRHRRMPRGGPDQVVASPAVTRCAQTKFWIFRDFIVRRSRGG
jgi:hypothetical protein